MNIIINKKFEKTLLKSKLKYESKLVQDDSMEVLKEFESLEDITFSLDEISDEALIKFEEML